MIRNIKAVVLFTGFALVGCGGATQTEYQNAQVSRNTDGTHLVTDGQQSENVSQVDLGDSRSAMAEVQCCRACICDSSGCTCGGCDACK